MFLSNAYKFLSGGGGGMACNLTSKSTLKRIIFFSDTSIIKRLFEL